MFIAGSLWALYLGFAPVYWLPTIDVSLLSNVKYLVLIFAIIATLTQALLTNKLTLPKGVYGLPGFFMILIFSTGAFYQAEVSGALQRTQDLFFGFIALWAFHNYWLLAKNPEKTLWAASLIIVILSAYVILAKIGLSPDFRSPAIFNWTTVSISGFGSLRTGWSNAMSFYVIPIFILALYLRKANLLPMLILIFLSLIIFLNQGIVAGRSGMLSSLFGIFFIVYLLSPNKKIIFLLIFLLGVPALLYFGEQYSSHFRFDRVDAEDINVDNLDHLAAGRITTYIFGLEKWLESPLIGHGYGNAEIKGTEIHSLWIRLLAEGGIFFFSIFAYICIKLILMPPFGRRLKFLSRECTTFDKNILYVLYFIILQGVIMSFFEPRMLLGSFQVCAVWWVAVGAYLAQIEKVKNLKRRV